MISVAGYSSSIRRTLLATKHLLISLLIIQPPTIILTNLRRFAIMANPGAVELPSYIGKTNLVWPCCWPPQSKLLGVGFSLHVARVEPYRGHTVSPLVATYHQHYMDVLSVPPPGLWT